MVSLRKEKTTKISIVFISLLAMLLLLTACGQTESLSDKNTTYPSNGENSVSDATNNEETANEQVVKDAMGHEVTIPAHPQRIIASYLEDPLVALGVKPVAQWSVGNGQTVQDYLQTELQGIPTINYDLPPEEVMSFSPDLIVIGSESLVQNGLYEKYEKIAPTYVLGDEISNDWRKTLLKLGELLNQSNAAEKMLQDYDQKVKEAKEKLQNAIGEKSVAVLWLTQKQFYMVDETRSSGAVLYGDLGLNPPNLVTELSEEAKATWNPVSLEKLAELNADYIFLVNSDKAQGDITLNDPIWQGIPAVKAGHVYEMSTSSSWLYSGLIANEKIIEDVLKTLVK